MLDPLPPGTSAQLALDLALPAEDELDAAQVSAEGLQALDAVLAGDSQPGWAETYRELRETGWPWRVAAYIAWAASPADTRLPRTQGELARQVLALRSDRTIRVWREKNPFIDEVVSKLQVRALFSHRQRVLAALAESASTPNYKHHNDRRLFLEMTGDYTPRMDATLRNGNSVPFSADDAAVARAKLNAFERQLAQPVEGAPADNEGAPDGAPEDAP